MSVVAPAVWVSAEESSRLPLLAPLSFQPTRLGFDRDQTPVPTWIGAPNSRALSLDGHGGSSSERDTAPRSTHGRLQDAALASGRPSRIPGPHPTPAHM